MFERVTILGSGRTAPGIAAACSAAGLDVVIAARDPDRAARAAELGGVASAALGEEAVAGAHLVIETVAEDLSVKTELLSRIEPWISPGTVVATNTSSLSVTALATALERPDRFAGLHFLFPAHETAAVEVVAGDRTAPETVAALAELVVRMGKTPLVVRRDVPGFIWNRLQFALFREALHLLDEGVADVAAIDAAVSEALAPRWVATGPFATADLGGIATFAAVAEQLFPVLSDERAVPGALAGRERFYRWTAGEQAELARLRGEAVRLLRELSAARRAAMPEAD